MVKESAEEIERMLAADAWLKSGRIAKLLGRDRSLVWSWLQAADLRFRQTMGGQKEYHPDDIRAFVAKMRQVHGKEASDG